MIRRQYSLEQIISILCEAEELLDKGTTVIEIIQKFGIDEQTYRQQKKYNRMRFDQAKQLRELKQENARLTELVAELSYENAILKKGRLDTSYLDHYDPDDISYI